jgi:tetratricopeptide (TPR) repeat protein
MTMTLMRSTIVLGALFGLLLGGCGGDEKKESGTADEFLKKEKAKQAEKDKAAADKKVAEAKPTPKAEEKKEPTPAPPPTPAPTEPAASDKTAPIPTAEVSNALMLVRRGQYEQAINQAKAALRRNEKYAPAMVVMGRAYYQLNKSEFAESICDLALSIDASQGECHIIKGFVALKNDNDPVAREQFEKATKAKPGLGAAWLNLGVQYLKVKNYTAAITALEEATRLMASRAEAHLNLGSAYRGAGAQDQLTKAQASYTKALQLKPNYAAAYFNLGILFLDAVTFPGMTKLQQLNTAVSHFNSYKRAQPTLPKDDPVDGYIKQAQKDYERETKAQARDAARKARDAAKKAAPAPAPAPKGTAPAPDKKTAPAPEPAPKK